MAGVESGPGSGAAARGERRSGRGSGRSPASGRVPVSNGWGAGSLLSLLGVPAISVPFGRTAGDLPVGLPIVGRATRDHRGDLALLRFAHAFEQAAALPRRFPPYLG